MTSRKVLIVDDNSDLRYLTRLSVEDSTCSVVGEARNGVEAIDLAGELRPDVIVMDMKMPVMDGIEATKILKHRFPDLEIIIVSASDDPVAHDAMLEAGASGSVDKGNLEQLVIRLDEGGETSK